MKTKIYSLFAILTLSVTAWSQGVGINETGTNPDPSAILDVQSTTQGMLTPRMTEAQRTAIATPANGLLVYQTDATLGFYFYNGTTWTLLTDASKFLNNPTDSIIDLKFLSDGVTPRDSSNRLSFFDDGRLRIGEGNITYSTASRNQFTISSSDFSQVLFGGTAYGAVGGTNPFFPSTQFNGNKARGTEEAKASVQAGDFLSTLSSGNYGVSGWHFNSARVSLRQEATPTATSNPTQILFGTTSSNSLNATDKMVIRADGNVGIGTTTPNASAQLDLSTTARGFLPPRMNASQMNMISSPAEGLVVYCTNCIPTKGLRVFDGASWVNMQGNPAPVAAFTFTGNFYHMPNFYAGKVMGADNLLYLEVNVTTAGEINFSSPTVNGYAFSLIVQAATTGVQYIEVLPAGTQTAYNATGDTFTITGVGTTTESQNVTITHSQLGSTLTAYSNGAENFSENATCQTQIVSTTAASNCPATVIVGANTYNTVFINGQCWFKENLAEAPTVPCDDAINTGCNTWLATSPGDIGAWGYYNDTTNNGTAGWRTDAPALNEGLLYQWSAAMAGSTTERAKGVCPAGWHIPSDCELMYLEHGQGMSIAQQTTNGAWRNTTDEGQKLKGIGGSWNNSSGFTALMPGFRTPSGAFANRLFATNFWTSSETASTFARMRSLLGSQAGVFRGMSNKATGQSVRCLKD